MNSLVQDFRRRCQIVVQLGGASASQYLSSHKQPQNSQAAETNPDLLWSDQQDQRLKDLHTLHGDKWKQIASLLAKEPNQVEYRWQQLQQIERNEKYKRHVELPQFLPLINGPK